ncbi:MAG TPA: hypothetical protein P5277_01085 [Candidatus Paceibacterota bacterium]|nr:hypothetical protein [Candidatus Paceibacterota bacterium]
MEIKIKQSKGSSVERIEGKAHIKELFVDEDIMNIGNEKISVCFKGEGVSGIIYFSKEELDRLDNTIKKKLNFIKEIKLLVGDKPNEEYIMPEKMNDYLKEDSNQVKKSFKSKKSGRK